MTSILWTAVTYFITASLGAAAGLILGGLLSSNRIDEAYEEGYFKKLEDGSQNKKIKLFAGRKRQEE